MKRKTHAIGLPMAPGDMGRRAGRARGRLPSGRSPYRHRGCVYWLAGLLRLGVDAAVVLGIAAAVFYLVVLFWRAWK